MNNTNIGDFSKAYNNTSTCSMQETYFKICQSLLAHEDTG